MGHHPANSVEDPHASPRKCSVPDPPRQAFGRRSLVDLVPGLAELWRQTQGDRRITIALLDGPVDLGTPALASTNVVSDGASGSRAALPGPALRHGTQVASLVFG